MFEQYRQRRAARSSARHQAGLEIDEARRKASVATARNDQAMSESRARMSESIAQLIRRIEKDWISGVTDIRREIDSGNLLEMYAQLNRFARQDPLVKNGLRVMVNQTIGTGPEIQSKNKAALDQWARWQKAVKFDQIGKEIVRRAFRDGDTLIRPFGVGEETKLRFVNAENVAEPPAGAEGFDLNSDAISKSHGVITAADDVGNVLGYWVVPDPQNVSVGEFVPADQMWHYGQDKDSTSKRGESLLLVALEDVQKLRIEYDFQHSCLRLRLAVGITEKLKTGPSGITQGGLGGDTATRGADFNEDYVKALNKGSIVTHNEGASYEFMSPNLDAGDVVAFFRERKLLIAAGLGLPEYALTSDASNSNMASTQTAESPFLQNAGSQRDVLSWVFLAIYERVTGDTKGTVSWPALEGRDYPEDAKATSILVAGGIVSKTSAQERLGYDPKTEEERLAKEGKEDKDAEEEAFRIERERLAAQGAGGAEGANRGEGEAE